ncbi:MAG: PilN domain-containing protein [Gallionella sp.]|nr:PilN domain-containing protein [Gallionella sp.]
MKRINLLPHRAEKRRAKQAQFIALGLISIALAAVLVGVVQVAIDTQISYHERRNVYLKEQSAILDKQIEEIKKLREQTQALLARKNVVEGLQSTRSDTVHLLDQMLRILPDGVYLKSLNQNGDAINLVGYAQSNSRVSTLMRAIDDSPWLELPTLVEVRAVTAAGSRMGEFALNFNITKPKVVAAPVAKPAATKG